MLARVGGDFSAMLLLAFILGRMNPGRFSFLSPANSVRSIHVLNPVPRKQLPSIMHKVSLKFKRRLALPVEPASNPALMKEFSWKMKEYSSAICVMEILVVLRSAMPRP